jgi:hypothetical protein
MLVSSTIRLSNAVIAAGPPAPASAAGVYTTNKSISDPLSEALTEALLNSGLSLSTAWAICSPVTGIAPPQMGFSVRPSSQIS